MENRKKLEKGSYNYMDILKRIEEDIVYARKNDMNDTLLVLSNIKAEAINLKIKEARELTDSDMIAILKKNVKSNQEFMEYTEGRPDLFSQAVEKEAIYHKYLPTFLSKEEIHSLLLQKGAEKGMKMGQLMPMVMSTHKDQVNSKDVLEVIKEHFQ